MLMEQCMACHIPGGSGPFRLDRLEDVRRRIVLVRDQILKREMPPVYAQSELGPISPFHEFTDEQALLFQRWQQAGMPEGEPPEHVERRLEPALSAALTADVRLEAEGILSQVSVKVRNAPAAVAGIQGLHHPAIRQILLYRGNKVNPNRDHVEPEGELIASFSPGFHGPPVSIPVEGDVMMKVVYQPTGKPERVKLTLLPDAPNRNAEWISLGRDDWRIEADKRLNLETSLTLEEDVLVAGFLPEARHFSAMLQLVAKTPDGKEQRLFHARRWNLNFPGAYYFQTPVRLAKGTRLTYRALYDNTETCPVNKGRNPQPVSSGYGRDQDRFWMHILTVKPGSAE